MKTVVDESTGVVREQEQRQPGVEIAWSGARWLDTTLEGVVGGAIAVEFGVVLFNVLIRLVTGNSVTWTQEVSEIALYTAAFMGGAIAYARGAHMSIQVLSDRLPASWRPYQRAFVDWVVFGIAVGMLALFVPVLVQRSHESTPILNIPASYLSLPFALGLGLIAWFALAKLARQPRRAALACLGIVAILAAGVFALQSATQAMSSDALLIAVLVFLFVVLFLGVPVAFVLMLGSGVYILWGGLSDLSAVPVGMQSGANSFLLLAIPFFILVGALMGRAGLTAPLAKLVDVVLGRIRGGALMAVVVTMYVFSGISGSKVADVAAVGTTMRDMLEERKVSRGEVVAVLSASAIMGETVPPSIVLLILGSITSLSTTTLFMAGLVPAAVLGLCVMILVFFRARGTARAARTSLAEKGRSVGLALPTLILPVGLVAGIVTGIATPTEVSALAVAYAVVLACISRSGRLRLSWESLRETVTTAGMVLFIIAAAAPFAQTLASAGVSAAIADAMAGLSGSTFLFMLVSIVILIVMGQLLEGMPAVLIFAPLLLPIAVQFGINPVQYSMVLVMAMGIGSFAPPAGIGFYVAAATGRESVERSTRHFLPYLCVLFAGVLLLALVPWFTTVLPTMMGLSIQ
ncbi:TRAP transporter large permease subunit [Sinomonas gamaensis]|uniref:TRAP transporter large permease n=1 Tax=Sinomonas gamaensis TaxID=2565624 RepID=UPI0020163655|nr:TRAP transporter large permease subunit [Sinomonas gamaensis]